MKKEIKNNEVFCYPDTLLNKFIPQAWQIQIMQIFITRLNFSALFTVYMLSAPLLAENGTYDDIFCDSDCQKTFRKSMAPRSQHFAHHETFCRFYVML